MTRCHIAAVAVVAWLVAVPLSTVAPAQTVRGEIETIVHDYLAQHPDEVGALVSDYLAKHPEVLQQALIEMMKKRGPATAATAPGRPSEADSAAAIRGHSAELFSSAHQVTLGNPEGDVTLVEFFDYNCGYCKRALADTLTLLKDDPKLKVVLKEYPILGPGSAEAARIGAAVRMQDSDGQKYLAFHQKLLGAHGQANRSSALAAAAEAGADMARLDVDVASDDVTKTLDESRALAQALGIRGTPGYVVGEFLVAGAIGADGLKKTIARARN